MFFSNAAVKPFTLLHQAVFLLLKRFYPPVQPGVLSRLNVKERDATQSQRPFPITTILPHQVFARLSQKSTPGTARGTENSKKGLHRGLGNRKNGVEGQRSRRFLCPLMLEG